MKKYLEYKDHVSNKFWEINLKGSQVTLTYGRIGIKNPAKIKSPILFLVVFVNISGIKWSILTASKYAPLKVRSICMFLLFFILKSSTIIAPAITEIISNSIVKVFIFDK